MSVLLLFVAAAASVVVHPEGAYTNGWQKLAEAEAATPVQFTIVVKERNADRVNQILINFPDVFDVIESHPT